MHTVSRGKYLKSSMDLGKIIQLIMAIIDLVDKISSNIDNKKHSIGIFLDLSKAFDTIDHQILLRKLQCYGIRGIACDWFKSYLENRVQYTVFDVITELFAYIIMGQKKCRNYRTPLDLK